MLGSTMMHYKGYSGQMTYDDKAKVFHGEVIGLKNLITFRGKSVEELEKSFKESINFYLEWCKSERVQPEKAFWGMSLLELLQSFMQKFPINVGIIFG